MIHETNLEFINFSMAIIAMKELAFHYALQGFHVSTSVFKEACNVECTVFHDESMVITPPDGFLFSKSVRIVDDNYTWTTFYFFYNS